MKNEALINGKFIILNNKQQIAAEEFHKNRIPFAWINEELKIKFDVDDRDHQHWICEDFGLTIDEFEQSPRGYIVNGKIQLFIGSDFREISIIERISIIQEDMNKLLEVHFERFPSIVCNVYNGVKVGNIGEVWEPIKCIARYEKN